MKLSFIQKTIYLGLIIISTWSCNHAAESPFPPVSFTKVSSMAGNGRSSAVAFVIDNMGYVALGRDSSNKHLNDCWQYDPIQNHWTKKANFEGKARVNAMAEVVAGKAYVGLGFSNGIYTEEAYLKDFWMFDPQQNSWTQKASFPSFDTDACVSFVLNNNIYVCAGFNNQGFNNSLWKYEPLLDKWTQLNDSKFPARAGGVLCANTEHIYFGTGYRTFMDNDWWEYSPANDSWLKRKSMPDKGRVNGTALTIGDRFFVSTGRYFAGSLTGGHLKSDIIEYDTSKNIWYKRGNIPASERENAISFTINGKGYIGFGENDTKVLNDLWSFEP